MVNDARGLCIIFVNVTLEFLNPITVRWKQYVLDLYKNDITFLDSSVYGTCQKLLDKSKLEKIESEPIVSNI